MSPSLVVLTFIALLITDQKCLATGKRDNVRCACCWWNCLFMGRESMDDAGKIEIHQFGDIKSPNTSVRNLTKPALITRHNQQSFTVNPLRRVHSAKNTSNTHLHQLKDNDSPDRTFRKIPQTPNGSYESSDIKIIYSPKSAITRLTRSSSHFESGRSSIYKEKKQMLWNERQQAINKSCKAILSLLPVAATFRVYSQGFQTVDELHDFIMQQCINRFTELYLNTNINSINESSANENLVVFNLHETIVANAQQHSPSVRLSKAGMKLFRQINAQDLKITLIDGRMIMYRPKFIRFMWELRNRVDFAFYEEQLDLDDTYHHIVTLEMFYKHILPGTLTKEGLTEEHSINTRNFKFRFIHHNQHNMSSLNDVIANKSGGTYKNLFRVENCYMNLKKDNKEDDWFADLGKYITKATNLRIKVGPMMDNVPLTILMKTPEFERTVNYCICSPCDSSPTEEFHRRQFQYAARRGFRMSERDSSSTWTHFTSSHSDSISL